MSTRALIAFPLRGGECQVISCHNDGYPEGVGDTLVYWYGGEENEWKRQKLVELGDLSSLEPEIGDCVAYHRDRGESRGGTKARVVDGILGVYKMFGESDAEWIYLFSNVNWAWYVTNGRVKPHRHRPDDYLDDENC